MGVVFISSLRYECPDSYTFETSSSSHEIECQTDGTWTDLPSCSRPVCKLPPSDNADLVYEEFDLAQGKCTRFRGTGTKRFSGQEFVIMRILVYERDIYISITIKE